MPAHVALLRGINVGGKNLIPMPELKVLFEQQGFSDVATYIQSGNVVFRAESVDEPALEQALGKRFDYHGRVVVLSKRQFDTTLRVAPDDWGIDESERHNALFTLSGTKPKQVLAQLPEASVFERIHAAPRAIFWSANKANITKTMFVKKLAGHPAYKELTVRNHNTTFKLREMLAEL